MRRSGLSSALALLAALLPAYPQQLVCKNGKGERIIYGAAPAGSRLRVNAHGPVTLEGGVSKDLSYTIRVSVNARSESEARRLLQQYAVKVETLSQWTVLTAPGGAVMTSVSVRTPRLTAATVATSDGAVDVAGIEGLLDVDTRAGNVIVDRIRGDSKLVTGGGDIQVGRVGNGGRVMRSEEHT